MIPAADAVWSGLEFRKPMLRRNVEPLDETQMRWVPGPGRVSVAWQLWHIAEVEDTWVRKLITKEPLHFPFGVQLREASEDQYPDKAALLGYFEDVRLETRQRLEQIDETEMARIVHDPDFGSCRVLDVWMGVVTSFAWHAGQIALTAKLVPGSRVTTMSFGPWKP